MRKIALMMSALAVCMAASGQNAQSTFFPEGTTWVEKTTNIIESTYRYDNYHRQLLARGWWQGLYV